MARTPGHGTTGVGLELAVGDLLLHPTSQGAAFFFLFFYFGEFGTATIAYAAVNVCVYVFMFCFFLIFFSHAAVNVCVYVLMSCLFYGVYVPYMSL